MKSRTITISKERVFDDIDALTYKFAEVSDVAAPAVKNGMSSDATETLDGHILARNVEYRDAIIRSRMLSVLADEPSEAEDNTLDLTGNIVYSLNLDDSFKDGMLNVLATYIHRYLAYGALYDWYAAGMGSAQARVFGNELSTLETDIVNTIRSRSFATRPMQPFGPKRMPR